MSIGDFGSTARKGTATVEGAALAPAKQRILDTANRLFHDEGIRAVGVDRLIKESTVTKATFYKHYGAKDTLIIEYLKGRHRLAENLIDELAARSDGPKAAIRRLIETVTTEIRHPGFRGCPFLNAAAEFSDPQHPVRQLVAFHRDWYTERLTDWLREADHRMPGDAADELLLARDGAMAGGYAGDSISATAALVRIVESILAGAGGKTSAT